MRYRLDFWEKYITKPSLVVGSAILLLIIVAVVFGPILINWEPNAIYYDSILQPPSQEHLLGTDSFGRDILTRVLVGGRVSIQIGFMVMLGTTLFGVVISLLCGYYEKVDMIVMRAMDVMMAFPTLLLAMVLSAVFGNSINGVCIALTIAYTPRTVRIMRSAIFTIREEVYIEAARGIGVSASGIMIRHILLGALPVLIVQETFLFAYAILAEAGISFVGVGVQPPDASWGNILSDATALLREAPWNVIAPGISIMITVFALNLIGDGLREVLDPRRMKGKAHEQ